MFTPRVDHCARCGRALDAREPGYFNTKLNLAICASCGHADVDAVHAEIDAIEAAALERVRDRSRG